MPKRTTSKPRPRRSAKPQDDFEDVLSRIQAGESLTTALNPIMAPIGAMQRKVHVGERLKIEDAEVLHKIVRGLDVVFDIVQEIRRDGKTAEFVSFRALLEVLPEIILGAGNKVGVNMEPCVRFILAWDHQRMGRGEFSDTDASRLMVDAKGCWKVFEAALRSGDNGQKTDNPYGPPLVPEDIVILRTLREANGVAVTVYDIEAQKDAPARKKVGERLRHLCHENIGYVTNPPGRKRTWILTAAGSERLTQVLNDGDVAPKLTPK